VWQANISVKVWGRKMSTVPLSVGIKIVTRLWCQEEIWTRFPAWLFHWFPGKSQGGELQKSTVVFFADDSLRAINNPWCALGWVQGFSNLVSLGGTCPDSTCRDKCH